MSFDAIMSLNGSVNSQGIKVEHRAWLDIGSEEWAKTSDKDKAAAYQAAKVCGWTDSGIKAIIVKEFGPRIDDFMADVTIDTLRDLAVANPVEIEELYQVKQESPQFKVSGSDATFQLPK